MKEFYKNHILDLVLSILFLALGIVLLPVFKVGETILDYVVAFVLLVYLFSYLVRKLSHARGAILVLTVVEFVVILLIALGLVLKQLKVFNVGDTCQIVGLVVWLRGVVCLVRGYFVSTAEARRKYSLLLFFGYIALVTVGAWLFFAPIIKDATLALTLCIIAFVVFAVLLVLAIKYWPKKTEAQKRAAREKKEKQAAAKAKKEEKKSERKALKKAAKETDKK